MISSFLHFLIKEKNIKNLIVTIDITIIECYIIIIKCNNESYI